MTYRATTCKHCDKPAEWRWTDADGNEFSDICQRCMDTVSFYQDCPLWQFEPVESLVNAHRLGYCHRYALNESCIGCGDPISGRLIRDDSGFIDISRLPVLPLAVAVVAGYAIHFMAAHGIFASLSILAR